MAKLQKHEWFAVIENDNICIANYGGALMAKTKTKLREICDDMEQIENIRKINIRNWMYA